MAPVTLGCTVVAGVFEIAGVGVNSSTLVSFKVAAMVSGAPVPAAGTVGVDSTLVCTAPVASGSRPVAVGWRPQALSQSITSTVMPTTHKKCLDGITASLTVTYLKEPCTF